MVERVFVIPKYLIVTMEVLNFQLFAKQKLKYSHVKEKLSKRKTFIWKMLLVKTKKH